ncbi:MAG TPA: hypothetical protein VLJ37_06550 [bacterium]|nr:hypothetical protein [bacterium]
MISITALATPASVYTSWVFAQMEQVGSIPKATPAHEAYRLIRERPDRFLERLISHGQSPQDALHRFHNDGMRKGLRIFFPAPALEVPQKSQDGGQRSAAEIARRYFDGLQDLLLKGALILEGKPGSLSWREMARFETRLSRAQRSRNKWNNLNELMWSWMYRRQVDQALPLTKRMISVTREIAPEVIPQAVLNVTNWLDSEAVSKPKTKPILAALLEAARDLPAEKFRAQCLARIGRSFSRIREQTSALRLCMEAIDDLFMEKGWSLELVYRQAAIVLAEAPPSRTRGELQSALGLALADLDLTENKRGFVEATGYYAYSLARVGDWQEAILYFNDAISKLERDWSRYGDPWVIARLAGAVAESGLQPEASRYLERLINLTREKVAKRDLTTAAPVLVYGLHRFGEGNKAIALFDESVRILGGYRSAADLIQRIANCWDQNTPRETLVPLFLRLIASASTLRDRGIRVETAEHLASTLQKLDLYHLFSNHSLFK